MAEGALTSLMPYKFDTDDRVPIFVFTLAPNNTFGLYMPTITWWIQLTAVRSLPAPSIPAPSIPARPSPPTLTPGLRHSPPQLLILNALLAAAFSSLSYHRLLRAPRRARAIFGLTASLLWLVFPSVQLHLLDVPSTILRFTLTALTPALSIFRTLEAAFGFTPPHAATTPAAFALYFASPAILSWDADTKSLRPATPAHIAARLASFLAYIALFGAYLSLLSLSPHSYILSPPLTPADYLRRILSFHQLFLNLTYLVLFQLFLTTFIEGILTLTSLLTLTACDDVMRNPVLSSRSVADFWSRHWNLLIQAVLRGGVYFPVRVSAGMPKTVAVAATFAASGLLHEWLIAVAFDGPCPSPPCVRPTYGPSFLFFAWQAALVLLEWRFGPKLRLGGIPLPLRSLLVMGTALPVGHWFAASYLESDIFRLIQIGFPMVLRILPHELAN